MDRKIKEIVSEKAIEPEMNDTLLYLLNLHRDKISAVSSRVTVKTRNRNILCRKCKQECTYESYYTQDSADIEVIVLYTSCDCGYVNVYNIGGREFEWGANTVPTICPYREDGSGSPASVPEWCAQKIVESKLVKYWTAETP